MTELSWKLIKHFVPKEFDSPDKPGSGAGMNLPFVVALDAIREIVGKPLKINSGFRTEAHNKAVGGVPHSAHTKGLAADIVCNSDETRAQIVRAAIKSGITRIGIGKTFVHLDMDKSLPTPRLWLY